MEIFHSCSLGLPEIMEAQPFIIHLEEGSSGHVHILDDVIDTGQIIYKNRINNFDSD